MFTFKAVNIAEKSPCSCKLEQFTFMFVIKLTAGAPVHKHKVESMKHMMHECTQPWSHIVSFIIHKIDYWQVQVGAKSSTAPEKCVMHRINTIQMFKAFPLAERRGQTRMALFRTPEVHLWTESNCTGEDESTERGRGGRRWAGGCGPCLEACGWLCWFTACQRWSLLNSGDKCSQMLWPYYGKEVCQAHWGEKSLPVEWALHSP